jgi:hypothetical protein
MEACKIHKAKEGDSHVYKIKYSWKAGCGTETLFGTHEFWVRGIRKREFSSSRNDVNCCTEPPCDVFSSRVCEECCKLVTALKIDWTKSWTFGILPCLSYAMFFNMYSPAWCTTWHAQFCHVAQLPFFRFTSASSSFIGIYFRFLIFYWYLLPFPHLLVVSVYLLVVSVYLLVVSVYLLVVSVYDIDVFAHNINV